MIVILFKIFKWFFEKNKQKGPLPLHTCFPLTMMIIVQHVKKEEKTLKKRHTLWLPFGEQVSLFHIYRLKKKQQRSNLHSMRSCSPSTSRHQKSKSEIFVGSLCSAGNSKVEKIWDFKHWCNVTHIVKLYWNVELC